MANGDEIQAALERYHREKVTPLIMELKKEIEILKTRVASFDKKAVGTRKGTMPMPRLTPGRR